MSPTTQACFLFVSTHPLLLLADVAASSPPIMVWSCSKGVDLPDEFLETIYKSILEHPIMPFDDSPEGAPPHSLTNMHHPYTRRCRPRRR